MIEMRNILLKQWIVAPAEPDGFPLYREYPEGELRIRLPKKNQKEESALLS